MNHLLLLYYSVVYYLIFCNRNLVEGYETTAYEVHARRDGSARLDLIHHACHVEQDYPIPF